MAGSFSRGRETRESAGNEGTSRSRSRSGSPERLQELRNSAARERQDYINDPIRIEQQRVTAGERTPEPGGSTDEEYEAWKAKREGKGIAKGKRRAETPEEEENPTKRLKTDAHDSDMELDYSSGSDDLFSSSENNSLQRGGIKIEVTDEERKEQYTYKEEIIGIEDKGIEIIHSPTEPDNENNSLQRGGIKIEVTDGKLGENENYLQRAREKGVVIEVRDDQNNLPSDVKISHSPTGLEGQEDIPPEILAFLEREGKLSGFPLGESSGSHFEESSSKTRLERAFSGRGDPLENEIDKVVDHIDRYHKNIANNSEALDAALKAVGTNRETMQRTIENIEALKESSYSEEDSAVLMITNSQFEEIEKAIESASDGGNPLQHEINRMNRHIDNFANYLQENKEVLDMALEAAGMDGSKLNKTLDSIRNITEYDRDNIDKLRNINTKFDEIEKTVKFILGESSP